MPQRRGRGGWWWWECFGSPQHRACSVFVCLTTKSRRVVPCVRVFVFHCVQWCCWACPLCFCSVCPAKSTGEGASRGGKAQLCGETLLATTFCPSPLLRRMQLTLFDSILFAVDKKKMMVSPRERCAMRARRRAVGDVERPASVLMT